jgi:GT2 family glycosyltransferase
MVVYDIVSSIVLYKNNRDLLRNAINSFLRTNLRVKLYLVDNSPDQSLSDLASLDPRIEYIFNNANLGFGKAHNIAIRKSMEEAKYYLVLNPDISFEAGVLEKLFAFMEANPLAGQCMPRVLYPDGSIQRLVKLLPSPVDLLLRRFFPWFPGAEQRNRRYELVDSGYDKVMNIPFLSGCFMFFRMSALREIGFFDDRIFMYTEDLDLTRRMHQRHQTLFYPGAEVYHEYAKGSYKSLRLMWYNIHGAMIYFTKWGWIFDSERKRINRQVLEKYVPARPV